MDSIREEIIRLKQERNAIILAHNYVDGALQDIADFCGDSLQLSIEAARTDAKVMVVCGVRFMAETAKLLSPGAIVLLPEADAGCPMADMASPAEISRVRREKPDAVFAAYVNTTAATKAAVDICCTSGNAQKIISSIPPEKEIVFLPDRNLGRNVAGELGRDMYMWDGCCPIHDAVTVEMLEAARQKHPDAEILIHPECRPECIAAADTALSTGGMLDYVKKSDRKSFIIATECGILHRLKQENPDREFFELDPPLVCRDMKKITLAKVRDALLNLAPQVELPAGTANDAVRSIRAMLAVK